MPQGEAGGEDEKRRKREEGRGAERCKQASGKHGLQDWEMGDVEAVGDVAEAGGAQWRAGCEGDGGKEAGETEGAQWLEQRMGERGGGDDGAGEAEELPAEGQKS